jgi:hypothetical protein
MITDEQIAQIDKQTIAGMDRADREEEARLLELACQMFLTREREFQKIAQHPDVVTNPQMNCLWWDRLEAVYAARKHCRNCSWALSRPWSKTVCTRGSGRCCWRVPDWRRTHD